MWDLATLNLLNQHAQVRRDFPTRRVTIAKNPNPCYDPDSLITGEELSMGLDYDCPRHYHSQYQYDYLCSGRVSLSKIPLIAPRYRRYVSAWDDEHEGGEVRFPE